MLLCNCYRHTSKYNNLFGSLDLDQRKNQSKLLLNRWFKCACRFHKSSMIYIKQCALSNVVCSETNRLPLLGDKQDVLIERQTGCPYWGTNRLPLLGGKQDVGGQLHLGEGGV